MCNLVIAASHKTNKQTNKQTNLFIWFSYLFLRGSCQEDGFTQETFDKTI